MVAAGAAGVCTQTRGAAELADDDDQNLFVEASLKNVFDQCRQGLIHERQADSHVLAEVAGPAGVADVVVPVRELLAALWCVEVNVDCRRSVLGQSPREQTRLTPLVAAVAVAKLVRFLFDGERLADVRAGHQVEGEVPEPVDSFELTSRVQIAAKPVKILDERSTVAQEFSVASGGQLHLRRLVALRVRIAGLKPAVVQTEVRRASHVRVAGDRHVRRHCLLADPLQETGDRTEVRMIALRLRRRVLDQRRLAGQRDDAAVAVAADVVVERPDERELVGDHRLPGKQLADIHPGHVGRNRIEHAAIIQRRVRF